MSLLSIIKTSVTAVIHPLLPVLTPLLKENETSSPPTSSPLPHLVAQNPTLSRSLGLWPFRESLPTTSQRILDRAHEAVGTKYQWGGESKSGMDCSHFVHHVYRQAGISYPYTTTHGDWTKAGFEKTTHPQKGDIIMWNGHMGIIVDPDKKIFIGAQKSTGVAEASYAPGKYWGNRPYYFLTSQNNFH